MSYETFVSDLRTYVGQQLCTKDLGEFQETCLDKIQEGIIDKELARIPEDLYLKWRQFFIRIIDRAGQKCHPKATKLPERLAPECRLIGDEFKTEAEKTACEDKLRRYSAEKFMKCVDRHTVFSRHYSHSRYFEYTYRTLLARMQDYTVPKQSEKKSISTEHFTKELREYLSSHICTEDLGEFRDMCLDTIQEKVIDKELARTPNDLYSKWKSFFTRKIDDVNQRCHPKATKLPKELAPECRLIGDEFKTEAEKTACEDKLRRYSAEKFMKCIDRNIYDRYHLIPYSSHLHGAIPYFGYVHKVLVTGAMDFTCSGTCTLTRSRYDWVRSSHKIEAYGMTVEEAEERLSGQCGIVAGALIGGPWPVTHKAEVSNVRCSKSPDIL